MLLLLLLLQDPLSGWTALPPEALDGFSNPQVLLNPEATESLAASLPEQAQGVLQPLLDTMRLSLSEAITEAFLIGLGVVLVAWAANWFLEEIPLRKTHEAPAGVEGETAAGATVQAGSPATLAPMPAGAVSSGISACG